MVAAGAALFSTGASLARRKNPYSLHFDLSKEEDLLVWRDRFAVLISVVAALPAFAGTTPTYLNLVLVWTSALLWFEEHARRALVVSSAFLLEITVVHFFSAFRDPTPGQTASEAALFAVTALYFLFVVACFHRYKVKSSLKKF